MKFKKKVLVSSLILLLSVSPMFYGCSLDKSNKKEQQFNQLFSNISMNTEIKFGEEVDSNGAPITYSTHENLALGVFNVSKDVIQFQNNKGLRVFTYDEKNNTWIELFNNIIYDESSNSIVPPKSPTNPGYSGIDFTPNLQNPDLPIKIRIVVMGILVKEGMPTKQRVGAYTDIYLKPK